MTVKFRILPSQADELAAVCRIGKKTLENVAIAIQKADLTIRRDRIREIVSLVVQDEDECRLLCRVIYGLSAAASRDVTKIEETVDGITSTLRADHSDDARLENWSDVSEPLLKVLQCESVYLAAKAVDVAFDFERVLTKSRIITSIRPVFNNGRDRIVGNTVVHDPGQGWHDIDDCEGY